ncbi:MAG: diversity-generating retroelement protein Avd [Gammaproteobacteria bacterium]|nr:diversity-generating retroelement protein Avd [Gammaproteobacteria bacterium]
MKKNRDTTPKAVQRCHELLLWVIPHLDKMPRSRRFTLGDRLETALLEVLERLVTAAYSRDKRKLLSEANRKLEVARHLWRLAMELQAVNQKSWSYGAELMLDLGRQMGGWIRSLSPKGASGATA